ncbi:MAG: hypothetical protein KDE55_18115 [Novosphingobium sp.]|nr:hypothetical protein [Novosphingobium sp.]
MSPALSHVIAVVSRFARCAPSLAVGAKSAVDQDLRIQGDDAEEFIADLAGLNGDWVYDWPWHRYVNLNEPPASLGPRFWKLLRLPEPERAFPGYMERRLELQHIAAVIEKGEWFDP